MFFITYLRHPFNDPINNSAVSFCYTTGDRGGFTPDDTENSPHRQALAWYAGTTNLSGSELPLLEGAKEGEKIYRRLGDLEPLYRTPNSESTWYSPDYRGYPDVHGAQNAPWEGIGTGWFYSVLGGGYFKRPDALLGVRTEVSFDNTAQRRMRGDFAVPTLFNGNFDAITSRFEQQNIPGWSFYNGNQNTTQNVSQRHLVEWSDIGSLNADFLGGVGYDTSQPNYALILSNDGQKQVTHNRFVVPEWGTLRFDLHVPKPKDGLFKVSIKGTEPDDEWLSAGEIDLKLAEHPAESESAVGYYDYVNGEYIDPYTYSLDYALQGFETFHLDIPENLRGKSALLQFTLEGDSTVYLDDVFFKSQHLKLGNPTFARPFEDTHRENYLIEKPQYSLSYNDAIKGPNWVSWQLNKSWLGSIQQENLKSGSSSNYPPPGFPPPILDSYGNITLSSPDSSYAPNYFKDYPWVADGLLPDTWVKTQGPDYRLNERGFERGHMTAAADRSRTFKDIYATFTTTNLLPQHQDNNQKAWYRLEEYAREQLVKKENRELDIMAGGYDYSDQQPKGHSDLRTIHNRVSVNTQGKVILDQNGTLTQNPKTIGIPNYTWKIIVSLKPGQGLADITTETETIAVIMPNRRSRQTPDPEYKLPSTVSYSNGFLPDGVEEWNNWKQWQVSIDYLEELTGYDFLSEIPEEIQAVIESKHENPFV